MGWTGCFSATKTPILVRPLAERRLGPDRDPIRKIARRREAIDHEVGEVRVRGGRDPRDSPSSNGFGHPGLDIRVRRIVCDGIRKIPIVTLVGDVDPSLLGSNHAGSVAPILCDVLVGHCGPPFIQIFLGSFTPRTALRTTCIPSWIVSVM